MRAVVPYLRRCAPEWSPGGCSPPRGSGAGGSCAPSYSSPGRSGASLRGQGDGLEDRSGTGVQLQRRRRRRVPVLAAVPRAHRLPLGSDPRLFNRSARRASMRAASIPQARCVPDRCQRRVLLQDGWGGRGVSGEPERRFPVRHFSI